MILIALLFGAFFPRILLFILWVATNLVDRAFTGFLIPLLGLIFLPFTTLAYILAYSPVANGLVGASWIWVLLALLIDLSAYSWGSYKTTHHPTAPPAATAI